MKKFIIFIGNFLKDALFSIVKPSYYSKLRKNKFIVMWLYMIFASFLTVFAMYVAGKSAIEKKEIVIAKEIVDALPDFELRDGKFTCNNDEEFNFSFGGVNFEIDTSKTIIETLATYEYAKDKTALLIASDAYVNANGSKLSVGNYYEDEYFLTDVVLSRDDFTMISEIVKMICGDIIFIIFIIIAVVMPGYLLITNILYTFFFWVLAKMYLDNVTIKESYKIVGYSTVIRIIAIAIAVIWLPLGATMNIRLFIINIITMIWLGIVALSMVLKQNRIEIKN